jgi:hypothetical protein
MDNIYTSRNIKQKEDKYNLLSSTGNGPEVHHYKFDEKRNGFDKNKYCRWKALIVPREVTNFL